MKTINELREYNEALQQKIFSIAGYQADLRDIGVKIEIIDYEYIKCDVPHDKRQKFNQIADKLYKEHSIEPYQIIFYQEDLAIEKIHTEREIHKREQPSLHDLFQATAEKRHEPEQHHKDKDNGRER